LTYNLKNACFLFDQLSLILSFAHNAIENKGQILQQMPDKIEADRVNH